MHLQDKQSNQKLTFSGLHPLTAEVTLLLGGGEGDQETSVQNPTVMKCTVCFLCKQWCSCWDGLIERNRHSLEWKSERILPNLTALLCIIQLELLLHCCKIC